MALPVAVNLSAHDLQDAGLPDFVEESLKTCGVAPEQLRLEITESSLMVDPRGARESLVRLRALGVRIAIDDFGTGYSSLAYLKDLPVDELKIDRSFVRDMAADDGARAIVRATIDLADDLGLRVVAEGVVTQDDVVVMGWPASLSETLTNLIFNAVDALPDGGTILLAAQRTDERVEVKVTDSGVGMPPELQARVFEPFFST